MNTRDTPHEILNVCSETLQYHTIKIIFIAIVTF